MKTETNAKIEMKLNSNGERREGERTSYNATSGKTSRQSTVQCGKQMKIGPTQW